MTSTAIIGYYSTKFGELWEKSLTDLIKESIKGVLKEVGLDISKVDAIFFSNMLSGILENNLHLNSKIAEILKVNIPIFRMESACSSGGTAFYLANNFLRAGCGKTVLVVGAEKMTDYSPSQVTEALSSAASGEEQEAGLTFPGLYGMLAQNYMQTYGYTEEDLANIPVKNHFHGTLNDKAQFRREITVKQVMNSGYVAKPLKVLDCSPISDGAASLVLSSDQKLIAGNFKSVKILACEMATDSISLKNRENLLEIKATQIAAKKAFKSAKITKNDIQMAEVHDCFSVAEVLAMEDIGFWPRGKGGKLAREQVTKFGSGNKLVVNTSGGLKAAGHPIGATGIKQIGEVYLQVSGQAEKRQVENCKYALAHNVGGSGGSAVVTILGKVK